MMGVASGYYLCNGDQLYASGSNLQGNLGIGKYRFGEPMPVYVQDKVTKIFSGNSSKSFFFTTNNPDLLYACGNNSFGQLGIGSTVEKQSTPTAVKNFKGSEILTVSSSLSHSVLITNEGQTYGCGEQRTNGIGVHKNIFTLISQLKEKKAVQLATEFIQGNLVLTDQNELYGWGFAKANTQHINPTTIRTKTAINYQQKSSFLVFLKIIWNQKTRSKLPLEHRTKLTIDQIQNKLFGEKSINKEQTLSFLKWIYYDEISDIEKLEQTFDLLELTFPPSVENTLEKDIAQLYQDDDSKDFKILVKIEDEENEEEEDNEDEDKEGNYEEIPVHKFILLARSGLFRAMFDYVNEKDNTNKVQDYTHKSIKSLEILIKYFYTNSIELTANEDPELIVEELSDAVEYYQLNDQCNFENELLKIKKQFELN
ncbi:btk-binding protein-related [Anaeramoeba flamelloides]|uniref:Btk-binding protein-related n=1 Tax=Anaeramoeba flamelloides TaxID=1746091 RepID=A0ABQ8XE74_9EUKA|nr:btk-binding protein-related [Anaeramoeba flamelloides]